VEAAEVEEELTTEAQRHREEKNSEGERQSVVRHQKTKMPLPLSLCLGALLSVLCWLCVSL
jgi:hypothetical protein